MVKKVGETVLALALIGVMVWFFTELADALMELRPHLDKSEEITVFCILAITVVGIYLSAFHLVRDIWFPDQRKEV